MLRNLIKTLNLCSTSYRIYKNQKLITRTLASSCKGIEESGKTIETTNTKKPYIEANIFHSYKPIMDTPDGVFIGVSDRFNGITVDSKNEILGDKSFSEKLDRSLKYWKDNKRRGIWFKVHTCNSDWVPYLTQVFTYNKTDVITLGIGRFIMIRKLWKHSSDNRGFDFHHAKNGYLVMLNWLPENEGANIPKFAHTMIGVGGLVLNEQNEILVVRENYSMIRSNIKLPGGYVEPAESLVDAVIREVEEETGIVSEFDTLLSLRHSHGGAYNCSDMYVVFGLRPISNRIIRCEREIAEAHWMPADEYLSHPNVHETNRKFLQTYLHYKETGIRIECEKKIHQILHRPYEFYAAAAKKTEDSVAIENSGKL